MPLGQTGDGNTESVGRELLQATSVKWETSVNVDVDAEDPNNSGVHKLPAGTILTKNTSTGLYEEYQDAGANGTGDESNAVVLAEYLDLTTANNSQVQATVYEDCKVKKSQINVDTNFDESAQHNITIWEE